MKVKMKGISRYLFSVMFALLFVCGCMGMKAEAATKPAQVTGLKQTSASSSSIYFEWTPVFGNVDYQVEISQDGKNWPDSMKKTISSDSWYFSGLNEGSTYYVRVCAYTQEYVSGIGSVKTYGGYSPVLECVTAPDTQLSYLRKTASTTNTMTLIWSPVSGANAYAVEYKPSSAAYSDPWKQVTVKTNTVKLTNLSKNETYWVNVTPLRVNSAGTYIAKSSYSKTEYSLGVTPTKVKGVEVPYYWQYINQINVVWNKSKSAVGYEAEVWTAYKGKDTKVKSGTTTGNSIDLKKTTLKKHYMFKVRVRAYTTNYDGKKVYGAWSSWKYTCPQPEVTKLQSTSNGMKVTWDTIKGADRYVLYASTKEKSGYKKVATTKKTSYTVKKIGKKKLKKGKKYYFYVVAYNKVGKKYYSAKAGNTDNGEGAKY